MLKKLSIQIQLAFTFVVEFQCPYFGVDRDDDMAPPGGPTISPWMDDTISRKSKMVAWIASNCRTDSRREAYVLELKKYMPVDIYGKFHRQI